MTSTELKDKYESLYSYMASSKKPAYMKAFGAVMNEMMQWMIDNEQEAAEEWIGKLCAIKWNNYLTPKEAAEIVSDMTPKAPWSRDVWKQAMENLGFVLEEEPYYNSCALWTAMNMVYSDSANTIASIMGKPLADIPSEKLVDAVHRLALDKLKDADRNFNIRSYFSMQ